MAKKCIQSGYMFRFTGKRRWRASKSDLWEHVVRDETCGTFMGFRNIDGTRHAVVRKGKTYYAALPHAVSIWGKPGTSKSAFAAKMAKRQR